MGRSSYTISSFPTAPFFSSSLDSLRSRMRLISPCGSNSIWTKGVSRLMGQPRSSVIRLRITGSSACISNTLFSYTPRPLEGASFTRSSIPPFPVLCMIIPSGQPSFRPFSAHRASSAESSAAEVRRKLKGLKTANPSLLFPFSFNEDKMAFPAPSAILPADLRISSYWTAESSYTSFMDEPGRMS